MAISVSPTRGVTRVPKSVKPESWQETTPAAPVEPVKPVPNPLDALAPGQQPDPKAAAEYYAYEKNEKARRRALKRQ